MAQRTIRVIMNGVRGGMVYRQPLVRSILAIRADGGAALPDGNRVSVEPILVGRNAEKLAALAAEHDVADFTTNLDEALSDARPRSTSTPRSRQSVRSPSSKPSVRAST